jgi:non-ribosomal peptide synthetase component F
MSSDYSRYPPQHIAKPIRRTNTHPQHAHIDEKLVRQKALDAYSNQHVPFDRLVGERNPSLSVAYHPLFQVVIAVQNNVHPQLALDEVSVEPLAVYTRTSKFDLNFDLSEVASEDAGTPTAAGAVFYATDLFERASIELCAQLENQNMIGYNKEK